MNTTEKKYNCDVIQDLLPLYQDDVCSNASKAMIEEHLEECEACLAIKEKLKNTSMDDYLVEEKDGVLKTHAKKERKRTATIGVVTAGILMIPVIICLICNIAIGHGLDWFFIVLASLVLVASITVVPLIVETNKGLWTFGSFVSSLLLLLLVICLYTNGHWFFVAAFPILLGLSIIFMPFVIYRISLPKILTHSKGLLVIGWDTLLLYAVIIVSGFHTNAPDYWRNAFLITSFCLLLPWTLFIIIRYLKVHSILKYGICVGVISVFLFFVNNVIHIILNEVWSWEIINANFSHWTPNTIEANVCLLVFITLASISLLLIIIGIILQNKNKKEKQ